MNKTTGVYQSFEFYCWASGMSYEEDYLDMMTKYSPDLKPVSLLVYTALCKVFELDFEEQFGAPS